jgi:hypothetical protein
MITILALLALCTSPGVPLRPELPQAGSSQTGSKPAGASPAQSAPAAAPRPRDPFVFRCVLDGRCRMVTLALADDLWAAWDAERCAFYKAWKGGVKFDGAVYTTVHGPQPTSQGASYALEAEGEAWLAQVGGEPVPVRARWLGYRLERAGCALRYALALPDGREVVVEERPEFVRPAPALDAARRAALGLDESLPGLERRFRALDLPADVALSVALPAASGRARIAEPAAALLDPPARPAPAPGVAPASARLVLTAREPSAALIQYFDLPPPEPAPAAVEGGVK